MTSHLLGLPAARRDRNLVLVLVAMMLLLWTGGSAILPLLPEYLRRSGSSPAVVGVVMAAYFAASVLTQFPAGRLSDRAGSRPVLLGGLAVFVVGSLGFTLSSGPGPAVAFRALQGIGAGAVTVAGAGAIGKAIPLEERGRAFGAFYGSQMLALAIGPLVGSILGRTSMHLLFAVAAAAALLGMLPVLLGSAVVPGAPERAQRRPREPARARVRASALATPALVGGALIFGASGVLTGLYSATWTLLLGYRHASALAIGLSWTLFALPFALLSVPAGRLAERVDRRMLAVAGLLISSGFAVAYPMITSVPLLVGLGGIEAVGAVLGTPAAILVLSEAVPTAEQGSAQGAVETARTAATALAAAVGGALFSLGVAVPYLVGAGVVVALAGAVAYLWRDVPGRVVAGTPEIRGAALLTEAAVEPGPGPSARS